MPDARTGSGRLSKARIYAAMAQKERELITERTRAALGGDRDYRPAEGLSAAATAETRRVVAKRAAHRLTLGAERLRAKGAPARRRSRGR